MRNIRQILIDLSARRGYQQVDAGIHPIAAIMMTLATGMVIYGHSHLHAYYGHDLGSFMMILVGWLCLIVFAGSTLCFLWIDFTARIHELAKGRTITNDKSMGDAKWFAAFTLVFASIAWFTTGQLNNFAIGFEPVDQVLRYLIGLILWALPLGTVFVAVTAYKVYSPPKSVRS